MLVLHDERSGPRSGSDFDTGRCFRTGEVMCTTPPSQCNGEMGVHAKEGIRQQLQAKVSGSLADRGVSTSDLWSPKPKAKVSRTAVLFVLFIKRKNHVRRD